MKAKKENFSANKIPQSYCDDVTGSNVLCTSYGGIQPLNGRGWHFLNLYGNLWSHNTTILP